MIVVQSAVAGIEWPAVPPASIAVELALQYQLQASQWFDAATIREQQFRQLDSVVRHAFETVPFWREKLANAGYDPEAELSDRTFAALPVVTRQEIQANAARMLSECLPPGHGAVGDGQSSGSTGMPIRYYSTGVTRLFWHALTLRDHLWHRRDLSGKLAAIRNDVDPQTLKCWGPAWDHAAREGTCALLNIDCDIDTQLKWLAQQDPDYILTFPSALRALAERSLDVGLRMSRLKEARTFGELIDGELRALCRKAWDVPLTDMYSAEEVGNIALQCPDHEHYHVQAESVIVEVLRPDGTACGPGEVGRVVISTLHNFAMPLIRYEIGDYAEVGAPCACGRGLPVLSRIMGRQRNILVLPDGRLHWPAMRAVAVAWQDIAGVRQVRVIQRESTRLEAHYVAEKLPTPEEAARMIAALQDVFGFAFAVDLVRVEELERAPNFKFEDFVSDIAR